jgi:hypothetical protein
VTPSGYPGTNPLIRAAAEAIEDAKRRNNKTPF